MRKHLKLYFRLMSFIWCVMLNNTVFAQKPPLDYTAGTSWPLITSARISNDGQYVAYIVKTEKTGVKLTVEDRTTKWKKNISGVGYDYQFTENSKWLIYSLPNDSIGLLELGKSNIKYIRQVKSWEPSPYNNGCWLACLLNNPQHDLLVINLQQNIETRYPDVKEFQFSPNGNVLVVQAFETKDNPGGIYTLNIADRQINQLGSGYKTFKAVFDKTGTKLAYLSLVRIRGKDIISLHFYQTGMDSAKILVDNNTSGMKGMAVNGSLAVNFSKGGDRIFFGVSPDIGSAFYQNVLIKNYRDESLKSKNGSRKFLAVVNLAGPENVIRVQQNEDDRLGVHLGGGNVDDYVIVESNCYGNRQECKRRITARPDLYLVSTKDGSRKLISKRIPCYSDDIKVSPSGRYLLWYDCLVKNWFAYNIERGSVINLTSKIKQPLFRKDDEPPLPKSEGIAAWIKDDESVLVYGRCDIWKVALDGRYHPINITQRYDTKDSIRFRLMNFDKKEEVIVSKRDTLLLSALNLSTKDNGFYKLSLTSQAKSQKLVMSPKAYYYPNTLYTTLAFSGRPSPIAPLKAQNANVYLLTCMNGIEYPNLTITRDFIHFKSITEFEPQKAYNWYTTELVHWRLFDGKEAEGILYKPENFDPKKKYPVIFYYYEKSADALNFFLSPNLSNGPINIPWFVSNGYVVFLPDIYYKIGHPGQSAYNSIMSAALMLSRKQWVNANKMGLQGHSFGGYETNYIVSHTHLFTAAASAAGVSDLVSGYSENDRQGFYENGQVRMGASPWQRPDLYIENSPVFNAKNVTTPLFIMHNQGDGSVAWEQGDGWYSNLVRLGKKVWMVSYAGENHTIDDPANELDYSIRLGQFFDYYLKDALPPKWMTEATDSLELDHKDPNRNN